MKNYVLKLFLRNNLKKYRERKSEICKQVYNEKRDTERGIQKHTKTEREREREREREGEREL